MPQPEGLSTVPQETFYQRVTGRVFGTARRLAMFQSMPHAILDNELPLRDELFSTEQLKRHATELSESHFISSVRQPEKLLPRLNENEVVINGAYDLVSDMVRSGIKPPPAGEWLLDNYYVVSEQILLAREHLPKKFSRELPALEGGSAAGFPRIYDLAIEFISHTDGRVDAKILSHFIADYQLITPLRIGELWAIPIMLRLALLENLRRVAQRIAYAHWSRVLAAQWSERLIGMAKTDPKNLVVVLAEMAQSSLPHTPAFVAEFCRNLQGQDPALALALSWFDQRLAEAGLTSDLLIVSESQNQAADQVTIGNSIGSMRLLSVVDWQTFVEEHSHLEKILQTDPAGLHMQSDFETRDACRHAVERLAKQARVSELIVAEKAIAMARKSVERLTLSDRSACAGFYLIDRGLADLARAFSCRARSGNPAVAKSKNWRLAAFLCGVCLTTAALCVPFAAVVLQLHLEHWMSAALTALFAVYATQPGVSLSNSFVSALLSPQRLPRLDFDKGIPAQARTLVAVPTMLSSPSGIDSMIEGLEIRYLANRDSNLYFALVTDFTDSHAEEIPADASLISFAQSEIARLNSKYAADRPCIFFLFHRPRVWNARESAWMGRERKRGKLSDLNHLLRGKGRDQFSSIVGDTSVLIGIQYVIVLDTDTQLPPNCARKLAATMAHTLNKPVFDERLGRVVDGYALLQPRVAINLKTARQSWFARICAPDAGIDPYTRTVSDVYQDLFGEGSFVGKGIYDVDAFERACGTRFPDNRILSHDLIEGCYSRSGLVSEVSLFEDFPTRFNVDARRRHRWLRGDWQIARWLLSRVPDATCRGTRNTLSSLSQWKIFDNMRRSLISPVALILLSASWLWVPQLALVITIAVACLPFIPILAACIFTLPRRSRRIGWTPHLKVTFQDTIQRVLQVFLSLFFLAFEALQSLDAIARTLTRLCLTGRKLLEWQTASDSERKTSSSPAGFYKEMSGTVVFSIALLAGVFILQPSVLPFAIPWLAIWILSPAVAWCISRPLASVQEKLGSEDAIFLREIARRTWRFFATTITAEENWLPPDNLQEVPTAVIAHRTSPTNMGTALLSILGAYDFGYLPLAGMLVRLKNTLSTLESLPRYKGHFFNWYDTQNCKPLNPMYVSSVDSGNLLGHLLTLRSGMSELSTQRLLPRGVQGLADTALCLRTVLSDGKHSAQSSLTISSEHQAHVNSICDRLLAFDGSYSSTATFLEEIDSEIAQVTQTLSASYPHSDIEEWCAVLLAHQKSLRASVQHWTPWQAHLPETLRELPSFAKFDANPNLLTLGEFCDETLEGLRAGRGDPTMLDEIENSRTRANETILEIESLAMRIAGLSNMKFDFLYDKERKLLSIGFSVADNRLDNSYYDLLASEARLASYVCIAQGQLPQEHWFHLGRNVTQLRSGIALLSWSGSMFEYLMPELVMPSYDGSLLDQTCRAVIDRQMEYAQSLGTPWGISESGYNVQDLNHVYQYRAFGVPGLGFKRGLSEDSVIAPYACVMAVLFAPKSACENLRELAKLGAMGTCGFYEALDFTPSRLAYNKSFVLIQSYMAHHQGMAFLALAHCLLGQPMQRRFLLDPELKAAELLLQERLPKAAQLTHPHSAEEATPEKSNKAGKSPIREFRSANTVFPHVQLLSNGRYHVMVTNSGTGYSRWKDLALTRWQEDAVSDCLGQFCYLRDRKSGDIWSTAHQPIGGDPDEYLVTFSHASAEFHRADHGIVSHTTVFVSPENDVEIRRLKITNKLRIDRQLDLTTYVEVALNSQQADASHPAFSKLFVQTEILPERHAILCNRRARAEGETSPWMFHLITSREAIEGSISYETDRERFLGRGHTLRHPQALTDAMLSDTAGSVLDPVACIQVKLDLEPMQTVTLEIVTGVAESREAALALIGRFSDYRLCDRAYEVAWTNSRVALAQLNITETDAQSYCTLASPVLFALPAFRAEVSILSRNHRGQSGAWSYGISGDFPIVLLRVTDESGLELAREALQAHAFLRMKGLAFDLVIWNEDGSSYRQALHDELMGLVLAGSEAGLMDQPGGVFIRRGDLIPEEDRILLQAMARVVLSESKGTLIEQLTRTVLREPVLPALVPTRPLFDATRIDKVVRPKEALAFYNGYGGFSKSGKEYIVHLRPGRDTPLPWCNVLANPNFGTVVSERGSAYTWFENAREFRLSPWHNDPVSDSSGEAFYIRDEESGRVWSPCPWPARGDSPYVVRHGFGYSTFETMQDGIASELTVFVPLDSTVKVAILKLRNESGRRRRLSAASYVEWVLGDLRSKHAPQVVTEIDISSSAVFARNPYNSDFRTRIAFCAVNDRGRSVTCDRAEFIGRNGSLDAPAALLRTRLSGRTGAGLDPCTAFQSTFDIADGREREIVFLLGAANDAVQARAMISRLFVPNAAREALEKTQGFWNVTLDAVQVKTNHPEVDFLVNGWLPYQVLSSRIWARSGFYQSGGAYGFRDQLQDVLALLHSAPSLAREHILRCAAHQFVEGDVQHWWHPPTGRGVRTQFSDDYLWLPFAVSRYVQVTGDRRILQEQAQYITGRALKASDEEAYYDMPQRSDRTDSLYEHCAVALRRAMGRVGQHGLPLMGCGDWNDGMNRVGIQGRGESVWLAFFQFDVFTRFAELARQNNDEELARQCVDAATNLQTSIEANAWDGQWYRRAYFDNGTPLGSATNPECQIDSLPQSWAVLSGAGSPTRAQSAMNAVDQRLVRDDVKLIQLFDPPFVSSSLEPGYIKAYPPGVRENGGQYTHGAIWAVMAFAEQNHVERAWELTDFLNPILHGSTPAGIKTYKAEPYVVAADVYGSDPHTGRGGWSWYTGSAGWMYRLFTESLLGICREGNVLKIRPRVPKDWAEYQIRYRFGSSVYAIQVIPVLSDAALWLDGVRQLGKDFIPLVDDSKEHSVILHFTRDDHAKNPEVVQSEPPGSNVPELASPYL